MGSISAAIAHDDLDVLFLLFALVCLAIALYLATVRNYVGSLIALFVGAAAIVLGT